jgi:hypothetical protein
MNSRTAIAITRIESSKRFAAAAMAGALSLAACGGDAVPDTFAASPDNRAALAAEAERYVELQRTRAAEATAATESRRANQAALAAEAERYVELQKNRAAEPASAVRRSQPRR